MTHSYQLQRLNQGLSPVSIVYQHDSGLSKKDHKVKMSILNFLATENKVFDPSRASLVREKIFTISSSDIEVILKINSLFRRLKKIEEKIPQRFHLDGVCPVTLSKSREVPLFIHINAPNGVKECEGRSLKNKYCLAVYRKNVSIWRESHVATTLDDREASVVTPNKISYLFLDHKRKKGYATKCILERYDGSISLEELIQWRARFKKLSSETEKKIVSTVASYLGFMSLIPVSLGNFKKRDIRFAPQTPQNSERIFFKKEFSIGHPGQKTDFYEAKIEQMISMLKLTADVCARGPGARGAKHMQHLIAQEFFDWGSRLVYDMKEEMQTDDFKGFSKSIKTRSDYLLSSLSTLEQSGESFYSFCNKFMDLRPDFIES